VLAGAGVALTRSPGLAPSPTNCVGEGVYIQHVVVGDARSYPLRRLTGGASPATYRIGLPTTSRDGWWIAESGTIRLVCRGAWITRRIWLGQAYVVGSDLHMVMGPGHPDF
jgi:hypothetical protein